MTNEMNKSNNSMTELTEEQLKEIAGGGAITEEREAPPMGSTFTAHNGVTGVITLVTFAIFGRCSAWMEITSVPDHLKGQFQVGQSICIDFRPELPDWAK